MSKTTVTALVCDRAGCRESFPAQLGERLADLEARARLADWTPGRTTSTKNDHYCPSHPEITGFAAVFDNDIRRLHAVPDTRGSGS